MNDWPVFTEWSVLACGEAGGRIGASLLGSEAPRSIGDRVLLLNTDAAAAGGSDIPAEQTVDLGSADPGSVHFPAGERCIRDNEAHVTGEVTRRNVDASDVIVYVTGLGDGLGSGSAPYLVRSLKTNPPTPASNEPIHVALALWPADSGNRHRDFNAVCGLFRLLRWYDGAQNADMVLLTSNPPVCEQECVGDDSRPSTNDIVEGIDILTSHRQTGGNVIDPSSLVAWPSRLDTRHFTPGIATEQPPDSGLRSMFDEATANTPIPIDPETSTMVYAFVRVPEHRCHSETYSERNLEGTLAEWLDDNGMDGVFHHQQTLISKQRQADSVDVVLLFGGFELRGLLDEAWDAFTRTVSELTDGDVVVDSDEPTTELPPELFERMYERLG